MNYEGVFDRDCLSRQGQSFTVAQYHVLKKDEL
jgi:hypothetical protein